MQADDDLLTTFRAVCEANDQTQAQVVRKLMKEYIAKNKQPDLLTASKKKGGE